MNISAIARAAWSMTRCAIVNERDRYFVIQSRMVAIDAWV